MQNGVVEVMFIICRQCYQTTNDKNVFNNPNVQVTVQALVFSGVKETLKYKLVNCLKSVPGPCIKLSLCVPVYILQKLSFVVGGIF